MKYKFIIVAISISVGIIISGFGINKISNNDKKVKNIILLIGDGMGLTQLYAGYTANNGELNISNCKFIGIQKTYSANKKITDSGAAGTAIACGGKTNNKMIGMTPDSVKLESILAISKDNNLATGLISTSSITHATPAAFYAHQPDRYMENEIAVDLVNSNIDLFFGGGLSFFNNRPDNINLIDSLKSKSYQVIYDIKEIDEINNLKVAGLFAENKMNKASEGRKGFLEQATKKALQLLSKNKKGFFLMVEGSQIDWACHKKDSAYLINEIIDFDMAVGAALNFAKQNKNTLVIITGDHETGGLAINSAGNNNVSLLFSSKSHSAVWVPVYAFGAGAQQFIGFYENTDLFAEMKNALGF